MVRVSRLLFLFLAVASLASYGFKHHGLIRRGGTSWRQALRGISNHPLFCAQNSDDIATQIHCNVELNADYIEAVGFDMDFTLAQYNRRYDELLFDLAKQKLHEQFSYPSSVLDFRYKEGAMCRGLVIDKQRGNILKIDRHKYVRQARHGFRELDAEARKSTYNKEVVSFSEENFVNIDSVSLLVEALLFAYLVDSEATSPAPQPVQRFEDMHRSVRHAVEACQTEGLVNRAVTADPGKYIERDGSLVRTLQQLRRAGKKTFLLTNSFWPYVDVVMRHLVQSETSAGEAAEADWQSLFDIIVVGANKPSFLKNAALDLFQVHCRDGTLRNLEDKEVAYSACGGAAAESKVFQGGCWLDLHRMLGVSYGDKILYVGDQMYSDILRSKRSLGWRTCLIVPELDFEVRIAARERELSGEIWRRHQEQLLQDMRIDALCGGTQAEQRELEEAQHRSEQLKLEVRRLNRAYDAKFNAPWGQLFKAGLHDSRFGKQVQSYACLYTSRVSNLQYVYPRRTFRPVQDSIHQEQITAAVNYADGLNCRDSAADGRVIIFWSYTACY